MLNNVIHVRLEYLSSTVLVREKNATFIEKKFRESVDLFRRGDIYQQSDALAGPVKGWG